ncbi:restriction endonuclease, type II-like superfamily protein [Artemisia annua]|uniref:Restriction endonuclease, type II-like superfamily protein n=1 Tax=Artemisia annua TaxID=35608 RepID=A0A2U1QI37_ARTAN|nr:restriction endonuclease, type II-like superfamily protein [Artemisia annua]
MVQFHEHIISDLLEDPTAGGGGLVILSGGLNLHKLIATLTSLHHPSTGTLLILSSTPSQKHSILSSNPNNPNTTISEITSDLSASQRVSLYASGGVFFITARILIVDLLTRRLGVSGVKGIVVMNAHLLNETCTEVFIVRLVRAGNREMCVWAFSDRPHAMVSGFAKAERVLKSLFLRKLHLWPRFQIYVSEDLERDPPEVVDIRVPMSPYMVGIQKAVIEVMDACLKEMRKTNKVDVEDLTVENGLFKSFDEIVKRQLDPIWHTLGKKTKQLVSDLRTLRKLLEYLVRYDAVTYLKYLDSLRASESFRSVWIFAESSYKIFEYAKKRVYHFGRSNGETLTTPTKGVKSKKRKLDFNNKDKEDSQATNTNGNVVLEEVLEEAPKWKVLREILEEIEAEREKQATSVDECVTESFQDDNGIVLVACKDEHSCVQLEECIKSNPNKVMRGEWEKYLLSKVQLHALPKRNKNKTQNQKHKGFGVLDGVVPTTPSKGVEGSTSIITQEHDALLAAATEISKQAQKGIEIIDDPQNCVTTKGRGKGKSRGKNTRSSRNVSNKKDDENKKEAALINESGPSSANEDKEVENIPANENTTSGASFLKKHVDTSVSDKRIPPVHFYAYESGQKVLDILKPSAIVVYHPDIAFVREIEVYKAENPSIKVKVYFLFYEDSTEVQKFEASIRRENGAFESLIRQKSMMILPVDQVAHGLSRNSASETESPSKLNMVTRKAGGQKEASKETQVIVDMREFMSSLPNVLHQKGMNIIPVTLEVGDYILSPTICVERKSIQDLFTSFASGRLYHQVEMMSRYYQIPVLLIEFSQDKSFSFQSTSEISDDVTPYNIISKISLLALHFPRLRIVWSRSLHATAEIFASLKMNQDEPDEAKATRVGVPSEEGVIEDDVRAENYNTSAVEFLRRLPGVTDSNYRAIMDGCSSLADLALLPLEKLAELMGGQKSAKTLRDFLDAKYPTLL